MHVFVLWEENDVTGENLHMHRSNMQRKVPAGILTRAFLLWDKSVNKCAALQQQPEAKLNS